MPTSSLVSTSSDVYDRLTAALTTRAAAARALAEAIRAGDVPTAVDAEESLPDLQAAIGRCKTQLATAGASLAPAALDQLLQQTLAIKAADAEVASALAGSDAKSFALWLLGHGHITEAAFDELEAAPWDKHHDLVALIGAGAWRIGRRLQNRGHCRVMVVDPSEEESPLEREGLGEQLWNLHSQSTLEEVTGRMSWPLPKQVRVLVVGPEPTFSAEDFRARLTKALQMAGINQLQVMEEAQFFALKAGRNLAAIASNHSIEALRGALAGVPAVVVAAGPSLDKNLEQLKELDGRVAIVAINQTVASLRRAGIRADIAIAVDPLNIAYHFEGTQPGDIGTLILGAAVDPALFKVPADRIVTFGASPMTERWIYQLLGEGAILSTEGTVSTGAMKLCAWMGCSSIISIGRDMALKGEQYYAASAADGGEDVGLAGGGKKISFATSERKMRLADGGDPEAVKKLISSWTYDIKEVPGFYGTPVKTTTLFLYEIEQVRRTVAQLSDRIQFINATEGGAYLEGMAHMSLAEVAEQIPMIPANVDMRISERLMGRDQRARRAHMATGLGEVGRDLKSMRELAQKILTLIGDDSEAALDAKADAAADLAAISRARPFVSALVQRATRKFVKRGGHGLSTPAALAAAERQLYTAIIEVAAPLGEQIDAALAELAPTSAPA